MTIARRAFSWATRVALLLVVLLVATPARAHLMPPQQGTLNVLDDSVFEVVAVPVSALRGVDDDGDGRLSVAEVGAHEGELQAQIGARFRLYDGEPRRWFDVGGGAGMREGKQEFVLVRAEHDERVVPEEMSAESGGPGAKQVLALLKTRFPSAPRALRLETDLFGTAPGEGQLTIRATRGKEAEVAILGSMGGEHGFFGAAQPTLAIRGGGIQHIIFGIEFLLFVLTILVAARAAGWTRGPGHESTSRRSLRAPFQRSSKVSVLPGSGVSSSGGT